MKYLAALILLFCAATASANCKDITYQDNSFAVCDAVNTDNLRLWHSDDAGKLLGSFEAVTAQLPPKSQLEFAMNAGMYHGDRRPVGLYIEGYKQHAPLVVGPSYGNFGLVPNGVFCITDTAFKTIETRRFKANPPKCRYASQSGPMLVIDGNLHPRFLPDSTSRYIRNGVGSTADGQRAVFAISKTPVTFHTFARLFRDHLNLPNALYFDGNISRLYAPEIGRTDRGLPLGPIIGVVGKSQ